MEPVKTILKYFFCINLFFPLLSRAQTSAQLINAGVNSKMAGIRYPEQVKKFYEFLGYQSQWINQNNLYSRTLLLNLVGSASQYGLDESDYHYDLIQSFRDNSVQLNSADDSVKAELLLSDAAIHFFTELAFGNKSPEIAYNGLNYKPVYYDVSERLAQCILSNKLHSAVFDFEPQCPEYKSTKNKLNQLLQTKSKEGFKEVVVVSSKATSTNLPLVVKFYQLGLLDSTNKKLSDQQLKAIVIKAQKLFNVKQDGILSKSFLSQLNIHISTRIGQLKLTLNALRWLQNARRNQSVIIVNIPSATLLVYQDNELILESKIIVGKPSTPTPTLTSRVSEVILYPYWTVPNKIAVTELLPSIKHNTGFLENNNYQVLNRNGKVVDPYKINWNSLSSSNFPYIIRQSTGCDNSLGIVKLNFSNPFGVYLHDTPGKTLFSYNKRYFSHGCMRVEKAIELAHLILRENTIAIDTLEEKGCLLHQAPVIVPANDPMAVFVIYNPAWIDSDMNVTFSEDVYNKFLRRFKNK
jgi:murein L,D-transpeptidase YcbB/YkuD